MKRSRQFDTYLKELVKAAGENYPDCILTFDDALRFCGEAAERHMCEIIVPIETVDEHGVINWEDDMRVVFDIYTVQDTADYVLAVQGEDVYSKGFDPVSPGAKAIAAKIEREQEAAREKRLSKEVAEEIKQSAKPRLREYVEAKLTPSLAGGKNHFECPCCGSGQREGGDGAFVVYDRNAEDAHWYCHSCEEGGDIFKLISIVEYAPSFPDQLLCAAEFFRLDTTDLEAMKREREDIAAQKSKRGKTNPTEDDRKSRAKAQQRIPYWHSQVGKINYFQQRGLSQEMIDRFELGYSAKMQMAMMPFQHLAYDTTTGMYGVSPIKNFYVGRSLAVGPNGDAPKGVLKHYFTPYTIRQTDLFNLDAITLGGKTPVFVCEAPIDAMSIMEVGGEAIGLGGKHAGHLLNVLEVCRPDVTFVLALDSDIHGQKAQAELAEKLSEAGILYTVVDHPVFTGEMGYKDANAALLDNRAALAEGVKYEIDKACALVMQHSSLEGQARGCSINGMAQNAFNGQEINPFTGEPEILCAARSFDRADELTL